MGSNISAGFSGRRMGDRHTHGNNNNNRHQPDSDSESEQDIATILQYLVRSGQVRIVPDSERIFHDDSDDEFSTSASPPQGSMSDPNPDTSVIDQSDLRQAILLHSGNPSVSVSKSKKGKPPPSVTWLVDKRTLGMSGQGHFTKGHCCQISSRLLPNKMTHVERYHSKAFCGMYAKDGDIFMTACQDCHIRIYDTRSSTFKLLKVVQARDVGWSILDTAVSPDGNYFVYSSWSECIHICNIFGDYEMHEALPLCPEDRRFCIFSLRFSQDGAQILGGANDKCLYIYDRNRCSRTLKISSHDDDVNTVAFADATSQILFSGGDDGLCKVWDRRTLNEAHPKPVGILAGHLEGITYIDSKGDGRHLLTNSKDQTIKVWDMRAFSPREGTEATKKAINLNTWDYRWQRVPRKLCNARKKLQGDTSLMTYRGHSVLQTLIRCHFSPEFTTGQKFIYTGCASGRVVVYDALTGKVETVLNGHQGCVRDVAWHPYKQEIMSSSWDGTVGQWVYCGKTAIDSDDEDLEIETDKSERKGLRRSQRIAEQQRQKRMSIRALLNN